MPNLVLRHFITLFTVTAIVWVNLAQASELNRGDALSFTHLNARSIAIPERTQSWPDGVIPYTMDASLPASAQRTIASAIDHWNEVGGVSLLPLAQVESLSNDPVRDSVRFVIGDYCASWVGRQGGQQDLWVALNCPVGSIMHEVGHLLGLEHEHTRPDRDQHIKVNWENIQSDKRHNFETAPARSRLPGAYDVDSIMHYGAYNFSIDGKPTITLLDGTTTGIGQRIAPSPGDIQAIESIYGSDLSVVARTSAAGAAAELDVYVSNQTPQGAHDVTVVVNSGQPGAQLDSMNSQWRCENVGVGNSMCKAHLLAGGAVAHLTMSLPVSRKVHQIDVQVMSKTPDTNLSNNFSLVASNDVKEPAARLPPPEPPAMMAFGSTMQDDAAVANVAMNGGAIRAQTLLCGLLALFIGQARRRVKSVSRFVTKHGWKLRCR